ncbi:MAG TPA: glutathione S-transferase [Alphaproteobacteria bacterium]|nr:glutathione S-transferase [Alphaproteobacteria bacterium]HAJ47913.1 glutathione S-transferase [Alphaproteobacteria bacterium]
MKHYRLYAAQGGGSMLSEIALEMAQAPYEIVDVPWDDTGWDSKILKEVNPLGQIPTLILPDGTVMTESAAIFLHVAEVFPQTRLAPDAGAPERAAYLRWLAFLISAIYPTFTYGDVTRRWVGEAENSGSGKALRAATDDHRKTLWRYLEGQVHPAPWFLGKTFSALDLYLWVMTTWRPGREWFKSECPGLYRIVMAAGELPAVIKVAKRNKL